jgi:hypothetical protein
MMQMKKVILQGEMKFSNPYKFFECLCFDDGIIASSSILLKELQTAASVYNACNGAMKSQDQAGISKIHDRQYTTDQVTHRVFTGLDTGIMTFIPSKKQWPASVEATGKTLRRFYSDTEPIFMPTSRSKHNSSSNTEYKVPDERTIQGRLYASVKRAMIESGLSAVDDDDLSINHGTELHELVAFFKNEFPSEYLPKSLTKKYWVKPKNTMYLKLSQDI